MSSGPIVYSLSERSSAETTKDGITKKTMRQKVITVIFKKDDELTINYYKFYNSYIPKNLVYIFGY